MATMVDFREIIDVAVYDQNQNFQCFLIYFFPADQMPRTLTGCDDWCGSSSSCIEGGSDCMYCGWNFGCKKTLEGSEEDNKNARMTTLMKIKDTLEKDENNMNDASLSLLRELEAVIANIQ